MPLLGTGVLAIWNGIAPEAEAAFVDWHVREHIPERVGVPGFLRGRRYVAVEGDPKYFNFYETESPSVLTSPAYTARLNAPTPWTRQVVAQFRDTSRTVCDIVTSLGLGEGGAIETIRLKPAEPATFAASLEQDFLRPVTQVPGIFAAHLLRGRVDDSSGGTTEKSLRSQPDEIADWIVLVEAVDIASLRAARQGPGSDQALAQAGSAPGFQRGLYQLQFGLTK
jgi:hypothetical protein